MTTHIQSVTKTPPPTREGKAKSADTGQQKRSQKSTSENASTDSAHVVALSPESISQAQKIVNGSGYITSGDLGEIAFTDEEALALSAEIARQIEKHAGGLVQPPSAELAGMIG